MVVQDPVLLEVERKHLAGPQAALFDDTVVVQLDRSDLRAGHHQTFGGHLVAARSQPVTVERGADVATVGECQRGRTVPRLDDRRVIAIERLDVGRQARIALPGGGHQDAERVQHVAPVALEQMQRFVEARGVRALLPDHRVHRRWQSGFARLHPGAVAEQRVDLAVVGQQAERLGQLPGWERVGRVALVEHGQAALVVGVAQVGIEGRQLVRGEQALVDERSARQGGDIETLWHESRGLSATLDALARQIQCLLEVFAAEARNDERLANARQGRPRGGTQLVGVDRHVAPAEQAQAFLC